MDEKTEALREIFTSVTDEDTITESQQQTRGSLSAQDDERVGERLSSVVEAMRERYEFETDLDHDELLALVRGFYDGESDGELASSLGVDPPTVFRARLDLHLLRESDLEFAVEPSTFRARAGEDDETLAEAFGTDVESVERFRQVLTAQEESIAANDRYRDEFDAILAESDLSGRMTEDVQRSGLEDATEGMETNVSF